MYVGCFTSFHSLTDFSSFYLHLSHLSSIHWHVENEIHHLRFQSSDDMNDVVKYIAAINDKVDLMQQNQLNFTE